MVMVLTAGQLARKAWEVGASKGRAVEEREPHQDQAVPETQMIQDTGLVSIVHMPMLGLLPRARCASSVVEAVLEVTTSDWENPHYLLIVMTVVQLQTCLLSHVHTGTNRNLTVVMSDGDDKLMAMSWKVNHTSGDEYVHTACCLSSL